MTEPDKLQAILDLVVQTPLSKVVSVDQDGNKRTSYSMSASPIVIPFEQLRGLHHTLYTHEIGVTYRKHSLVRKGLVDYLALEDTDTDPESGPWVVARTNTRGATGPNGEDKIYEG